MLTTDMTSLLMCIFQSDLRLLFIRREDYKAHPRQTGSIVRRLGNEAAIHAALTEWAATRTRQGLKTSLIDGHFSQVSFDEQLERVQVWRPCLCRMVAGRWNSGTHSCVPTCASLCIHTWFTSHLQVVASSHPSTLQQTYNSYLHLCACAMLQSATVILGAHGAGLSHVLFSREGTYVMEIATPEFTRPHFEAYVMSDQSLLESFIFWPPRSIGGLPRPVSNLQYTMLPRPVSNPQCTTPLAADGSVSSTILTVTYRYCIWAGCKYFKLKVHSTNPSPSLLLERLEGLLSS